MKKAGFFGKLFGLVFAGLVILLLLGLVLLVWGLLGYYVVVESNIDIGRVTTTLYSSIAYPNHALTPGDVMTTDTALVCSTGYPASVRDVSDATKERVYVSYGILTRKPGEFEVDHLVPIALGGSNQVGNLWPQAYEPRPGAYEKDVVENRLHALVCSGKMGIVEAQKAIAEDWYQVYVEMAN